VSTPTLQQARSHYERQRRIAAAALVAVRKLFKRRASLLEVASTVASYQLASAMASVARWRHRRRHVTPDGPCSVRWRLVGKGFPISEPIIATIDRFVPHRSSRCRTTGGTTRPSSWPGRAADRLRGPGRRPRGLAGRVRVSAPTGRTTCGCSTRRRARAARSWRAASTATSTTSTVTRLRLRDGPGADWEDAHDAGLVSSPREAFDRGQIRGLSKADAQAIRDGADIDEIVNATRGTSAPGSRTRSVPTTFGRASRRRPTARRSAPHGARRTRPAWCDCAPSRSTSSRRTATTRSGSQALRLHPLTSAPRWRGWQHPARSPRRASHDRADSEARADRRAPQEGAEQEPKTFDAEYVANLRKEAAKYRTEAKAAASELEKQRQASMSEAERPSPRLRPAAAPLRRPSTASGSPHRVRRLAGRRNPDFDTARLRLRRPVPSSARTASPTPRRSRRVEARPQPRRPPSSTAARGTGTRPPTSTKFCAGPQAGRNRSTSWHGWPRCTSTDDLGGHSCRTTTSSRGRAPRRSSPRSSPTTSSAA
jgi:hypothetical protein